MNVRTEREKNERSLVARKAEKIMIFFYGVFADRFRFVFYFMGKIRLQSCKQVLRNPSILILFHLFASAAGATELKYGELLFKCRLEKPRCSSRDVCGIEVFGHPKDNSYQNFFVTLNQGEEKNIQDPEFTYDTKVVLPATYEVRAGKYTIRVNSPEFPLRFFFEILTDSKKPESASIGLFRENKTDEDPIRYYCRRLKAGY